MAKKKSIIDEIKLTEGKNPEHDKWILAVFKELDRKEHYYNTKISDSNTYNEIKDKDDSFKIEVGFRLLDYLVATTESSHKIPEDDKKDLWSSHYKTGYLLAKILESIVRPKLKFSESDLVQFHEKLCYNYIASHSMPFLWLIKQIKYFLDKNKDSGNIAKLLSKLLKSEESYTNHIYNTKDQEKLKLALTELLQQIGNSEEGIETSYPPILWSDEDSMGETINQKVSEIKEPKLKENFYRLFALCKKTTGGKPSAKFLKEVKEIVEQITPTVFYSHLVDWINLLINFEIEKETKTSTGYNNAEYHYDIYHNISSVNADLMKPIVWTSINIIDDKLILLLSKLAEKCYKKIPGRGPANVGIGNACFYALAASRSMEAISQLSRLKLKLKQNSVLKLIDGYIEEVAKESGVGVHEMEDMAVQDHGLKNGKASFELDKYKAEMVIHGIGDVSVHWFSEDGKALKSVPAAAKTNFKTEIKTITETAKEVQKSLTAQRDRLDRSYIYNRKWEYKDFLKYFLNHGVMNYFAKKLIWTFEHNGKKQNLFWWEESWIDFNKNIQHPSEKSIVTLWHPIGHSLEEILAWRTFFVQMEIKQPFKQAFREVYILTDAEVNTQSYSNRMAAHILKQHQFNTLAKGRTWSYSLLGAYDDGRDNEIAELKLPEHNLTAQFWINEIFIDDSFNDAGIWNFVATDQIRFLDQNNQVVDLVKIDPLVFSEVMRDADLFVGVASVGNDPEWRDKGNITENHRNYWVGYSFGNLNETAKIRKQVLENLIPRLKISKVAEVKDKFLVVKGKLRTYKIHIGSTNILMEPNDEYLCIVPDRTKNTDPKYFLPFEGDSGLSTVISKAFLLAEDDKITDPTITRQIKK